MKWKEEIIFVCMRVSEERMAVDKRSVPNL